METFDITPEAIGQLKRLDSIFCTLLSQPLLTLPHTLPEDVHGLACLVRAVRRLPEASLGDDIALVVHPSLDPRKPFYRLQFGPRVIEVGNVQVITDPDDRDEWVVRTAFGAVMGLGAGCGTPRLVEELTSWIEDFKNECNRTSVVWRIQKGANHIGHALDPVGPDGDYA